MRNAYAQTAVSPYALRAKSGAPIATPLDWSEVSDPHLDSQRYNMRNIFRRLESLNALRLALQLNQDWLAANRPALAGHAARLAAYAKAHSKPSLIAGIASALLLGAAYYISLKQPKLGFGIGATVVQEFAQGS